MKVIPSVSIDFERPVTTGTKYIASRVLFLPATMNGKQFFISAADDEAEIVPVHVAVAKRVAVMDVEPAYAGIRSIQVAFA